MKNENTIDTGRCKVTNAPEQTAQFPFCESVIYIDDANEMGIEYRLDDIRIDGIKAADEDSFGEMMKMVEVLAKMEGLTSVCFADSLSDELLRMFLSHGFEETKVEPYNHYLNKKIS